MRGGLVFLLIAGLALAGLSSLTTQALRLEQARAEEQVASERAERLRRAMWRLDARVTPALAREESRPFRDYATLSAVAALDRQGQPLRPGAAWMVSPLLDADLPAWMPLHAQAVMPLGWTSPQVPTERERDLLARSSPGSSLARMTPEAAERLALLVTEISPAALLARVADQEPEPLPSNQPDSDTLARYTQRANIQIENQLLNSVRQPVTLGPSKPLWQTTSTGSQLLAVRAARSDGRAVVQVVVLDWPRLRELLTTEVADLFPEARLEPADGPATQALPDRMTALPIRLDAGPLPALPAPGWSPLRVGLASAWLSALVALTAAGLSGWSLADLAERRSRFVAAVTHELRTPLTTLRLYLDLLTNGLVRDASTRDEYLATLQAEADRLHRLVANVLDFARLERGSPQAGRVTVAVSELAQRVVEEWQPICQRAGRELVMDSSLDVAATCHTDPELVRQVLGILIDNAIKHGGNVNDPTIRLEVHQRAGMLICAIEDQGPGVVPADRRRLFRPFQRGRNAATTGGVGLGLALASRWARLLGGRLTVVPGSDGCGARFELAIPL